MSKSNVDEWCLLSIVYLTKRIDIPGYLYSIRQHPSTAKTQEYAVKR